MLHIIRKFGLEYCDLPTMLWNVSVFLKILTLDIFGKNKKGIPMVAYIITIVAFVCYIYVYLICMVWFVFVRCRETGDVIAATVTLSLGVSSEIGTLKLLYMHVCIDKIRNLTDAFLEYDSHVTPGSRLAVNHLKYMRDVKKRAIVYWIVIMGNGSLYVFTPCLRPGRHLPEDLLVIYGFEPVFLSPNYEISWAMQALSVYTICYVSANVSEYLIVIIGYSESQMRALSDEVTYIWSDAEAYYKASGFQSVTDQGKNKIMNEFIRSRLIDVIKRHATVKSLLNQVEETCRGPMAVSFILLILGVLSELLGGLENTLLQLPFAAMQVGMDCFIGQRLMDAGELFQQAVYGCEWENFDINNMKMVLVMLQASQRTIAISAGGLTQMSFKCLMAAMRATYSAYTALRSVM